METLLYGVYSVFRLQHSKKLSKLKTEERNTNLHFRGLTQSDQNAQSFERRVDVTRTPYPHHESSNIREMQIDLPGFLLRTRLDFNEA